jgi:predicted amidophosphoribosyltransferase
LSGNGQRGFCSQCGQPVDLDDKFCAHCGHAIKLASPVT